MAVASELPRPLDSYADPNAASLWAILQHRIMEEPFNLVASLIFLCAICHTFLAGKFLHWAHVVEARHANRLAQRSTVDGNANEDGEPDEVSFQGQILHFFGEVEAIFGIWAVVLGVAITAHFGWSAVVDYVGQKVNFTEPMFVVVIM